MLKPEATCKGCPLFDSPIGTKHGFLTVSGDGTSGVMVVGEAAGEDEAATGVAFVGKAGSFLWNSLKRVGVDRDSLTVANVIFCQPPENKFVKEWYEKPATDHCRPNLDSAISNARATATGSGKTFVIVTLGVTAFKRVLDLDPVKHRSLLKEDYYCYPFWSETYQAWVLAAPHPSYLMRGKHHEESILQFAFKRALDIAESGLTLDKPFYSLDPDPAQFSSWVDGYLAELAKNPDETFLSYDIETPYKRGKSEDQLAKEDSDDYTILRCAFSYKPGDAISVNWSAHFYADFQRIFGSSGPKLGWNSDIYDRPRVEHNLDSRIKGDHLDGMLAWHVLNSALPKGLGFVAPYYAQRSSMWKHLSAEQPGFYNAKDADMALRIWLGVRDDLKSNGLWNVFENHIIRLGRIYEFMSIKGLIIDPDLRNAAESKLTGLLVEAESKIASEIPKEILQLKLWAKPPKINRDGIMGQTGSVVMGITDENALLICGFIQVDGVRKTTRCPSCGALDAKAIHFKSIGKKKLKLGETENPCVGLKSIKVTIPSKQWATPLPFKLSNQSMRRYQAFRKHQAILTPRERKITFDDKAITKLMVKYPNDKLYPLIGNFRSIQKLRSTYVGVTQENGKIRGGMPTGRDGRVHPSISHNPSTLRSSMSDPNMQNLPRPNQNDKDALENLIRGMIVAAPGTILYARDFSGIEAKIVGYEALYPEYIRLCNLDVHSYYTAWALSQISPGSIPTNDLPLLSWDDAKLKASLKNIKSTFGRERNELYKHLVHAANFGQKPKGATETILKQTGQIVPISKVSKVMKVYFELFPKIPKWHEKVLAQADRDGYLRNPFGYVHRFFNVYAWEKFGSEWEKSWGAQANQAIAFGPQSTAAGIIKEAMLRLWDNHYDAVAQYLRLLVHDELLFEAPDSKLDEIDRICQIEMERPITQMKQPLEWGMGEYFVVTTEPKQGPTWRLMK